MHPIRMGLVLASAWMAGTTVVKADSPANGQLVWHGFFTTGASATDSRDPYLDSQITQRANFTSDTKLGLNLQVKPDPKWSLAGQLLAKTAKGQDSVQADWYFATFMPIEGLKFKVGRQILPVWMISEYIDVGRAYPWVRPPQEVYALNPLRSYDGGSVSYSLDLGGFEVTPEVTAGSFGSTLPGSVSAAAPIKGKDLIGATLNISKADTQVHGSYLLGKYSSAIPDPANPGTTLLLEDFTAIFYSVGARADIANVILFSEYVSLKSKPSNDAKDNAAANVAAAQAAANPQVPATLKNLGIAQAFQKIIESGVIGGQGWYGTVGYQLDRFTPFVTYASLDMFDDTVVYGDQKSYGGGIRYEPSLNVDVKAQMERVNVPEGSTGLFSSLKTNSSGVYDARSINMYSLAIDYVF